METESQEEVVVGGIHASPSIPADDERGAAT